jgi:hypothetical protein
MMKRFWQIAPIHCALFAVLAAGSYGQATDVETNVVYPHPDSITETKRVYKFTTNGTRDARFRFEAKEFIFDKSPTWFLDISLPDTAAVSSVEYQETIDACIDRFFLDVPEAKVSAIRLDITDDSRIWTDLRAKLVPIWKGAGIEEQIPKANAVARAYEKKSIPLREFIDHLARHLKGRVERFSILGEEGLAFETTRGQIKPAADRLLNPRLGISRLTFYLSVFLKDPAK